MINLMLVDDHQLVRAGFRAILEFAGDLAVLTEAEIAEALSLSQKTVSTYRQRSIDKLDAKTDVELTRLAYRHGVIHDSDD